MEAGGHFILGLMERFLLMFLLLPVAVVARVSAAADLKYL